MSQTELTDGGENCHCRRQHHDSCSEKSDYYHEPSRCLVPATEHDIAAGVLLQCRVTVLSSLGLPYGPESIRKGICTFRSSEMLRFDMCKCLEDEGDTILPNVQDAGLAIRRHPTRPESSSPTLL